MHSKLVLLASLGLLAISCAASHNVGADFQARGKQVEPALDLPEESVLEGLEQHAVQGKSTVFDFHAEWCESCEQIDKLLMSRLASDDTFVLRRIELKDWSSPVVKRYFKGADTLPMIIVYNPKGERVAVMAGPSFQEIEAMIDRASAEPVAKQPPVVVEPAVDGVDDPAPVKEEDRFTVAVSIEILSPGTPGLVTIDVIAGEGFKINKDFPWKAVVPDAEGVAYLQQVYSAGTWSFQADRAVLPINFTSPKPGQHQASAILSFSVCSDALCEIIKDHEVIWTVDAR